MLEKIRALVPPAAREQYYTYAAAAIMLLAGLGYISQTLAALWTAAAGASITLLFALLHSLSPWRTALYGLLAAAAPLAIWYSIGSERGWVAAVAFAGVVLGVTKAAANTSTNVVPMVAWAETTPADPASDGPHVKIRVEPASPEHAEKIGAALAAGLGRFEGAASRMGKR